MRTQRSLTWLVGVLALPFGVASAQPTPMPPDARAYIQWPSDGQRIVGGKLWVRMGLSGAGIAPAGIRVERTGHHHLLVDTPLPDDLTAEIPYDRNHLHFGRGQTEVQLELPPGRHTLQPSSVPQPSVCITSGMVVSRCAKISARTASCPIGVHLHSAGSTAGAW